MITCSTRSMKPCGSLNNKATKIDDAENRPCRSRRSEALRVSLDGNPHRMIPRRECQAAFAHWCFAYQQAQNRRLWLGDPTRAMTRRVIRCQRRHRYHNYSSDCEQRQLACSVSLPSLYCWSPLAPNWPGARLVRPQRSSWTRVPGSLHIN